jgi:hypothetical protein
VDLKLRTSEKIAIAELRLQSNISSKVAELRLRKCFLQVAELRLRTQKNVVRAHLWLYGSQLLGNPEGGETGHNKAYDFKHICSQTSIQTSRKTIRLQGL